MLEQDLKDEIKELEQEYRENVKLSYCLAIKQAKSDLKKIQNARKEIVKGIEKLKDHHSPYSGIVNANIDQTLSIINKILGDGKEKGE